ncbi:hypothetical protein AB894_05245 [Piscirickettsia salmonis]|nr:hypothetical protein AB894_05245 [Piscirickettsia salmonis]
MTGFSNTSYVELTLESQMITDEVFLSFCQTTILTITKVMSDFCVGYKDFEHKEIWLEGVKDKIHQGVDKFFNAGNESSDLKVTSKTFFQSLRAMEC